MSLDALKQQKIERLRWRCLNAIYLGGGMGMRHLLVLRVVCETGFEATLEDVDRAVDYLALSNLVNVCRGGAGNSSSATALGCQVVEKNAECPVGILPDERLF